MRYNYTHDQLNTIDISISFLRILLRRGGGAKFDFAPGRQLPSLRHCPPNWLRCSKLEVADQQGVVNSRS